MLHFSPTKHAINIKKKKKKPCDVSMVLIEYPYSNKCHSLNLRKGDNNYCPGMMLMQNLFSGLKRRTQHMRKFE